MQAAGTPSQTPRRTRSPCRKPTPQFGTGEAAGLQNWRLCVLYGGEPTIGRERESAICAARELQTERSIGGKRGRRIASVRVSLLAVSEIDDHAVIGRRQFCIGESAEHVLGHVSEHDPLRLDLCEVGAQRVVIEVERMGRLKV
jgi:hypothetical protein